MQPLTHTATLILVLACVACAVPQVAAQAPSGELLYSPNGRGRRQRRRHGARWRRHRDPSIATGGTAPKEVQRCRRVSYWA